MYTIISNKIYITNPSSSLLLWCDLNLVVTNPLWETLTRLGKQDQIYRKHIPQKMYLYVRKGEGIILPFGALNSVWNFIKDSPYKIEFNNSGDISCKNDKIVQPLYDYQEKAVQEMLKAKGGILVAPCGAGKSNIGIEITHRIGKKFLFLVHTKDLLKQALARFKFLYPNMDVGTITEGKINMGKDGTIATIQTMANLDPELYKHEFDVVMTDECFVAGTKIKTQDGYKNIEDIKVGDVVASFNHKNNKIEYKKVKHLFVKTSSNLYFLKNSDNILITATGNHPIYTKRGYVAMEDLKYGDYVLQGLWKTSDKRINDNIKMEPRIEERVYLLLSRMYKEQTKKKSVFFRRNKKKIFGEYEKIKRNSSSNEETRANNENEQPDVRFKYSFKNDSNETKKWDIEFANKKSWWKWSHNRMPNSLWRRIKKDGLHHILRISNQDSSSTVYEKCISYLLQSGYCNSKFDDSNRIRWRKSLWRKVETKRPEEEQMFDWIRLESVPFQEQTNKKQHSGCVTVYNFEVEDNNNYFANDILVHNCHHISGSPTLLKYFIKVIEQIPARYKFGLTATPSRGDTLIKSMYTTVGTNTKGEFEPVYQIDKSVIKTLTAKHIKVELETPFSYSMLNEDGSFNYPNLIDYLSTETSRNSAIIDNVVQLAKSGRKQLILCHRVEQAKLLQEQLSKELNAKLLVGSVTSKKREEILTEKIPWDVIVATYSLAKEGLDLPCLDTLHMVTPQKDKAMVVQCVGRIERIKEGKKEPEVYDYVDMKIPYCTGAFKKRKNYIEKRY